MPSSRQTGRMSPSTSRSQSEYSDCSAAIGWTAWARRIVSGAGLGQADVADLPLLHQLGHAADRLLDRRVGIDPVLVEEVDRVDAEPLQRAFAGAARIFRAAVDADRLVAVPAQRELGGDDEAVAPAPDRLAEQLLVGERAVHFGGVEEGDAEIDRAVDGGDRFVVAGVAP